MIKATARWSVTEATQDVLDRAAARMSVIEVTAKMRVIKANEPGPVRENDRPLEEQETHGTWRHGTQGHGT